MPDHPHHEYSPLLRSNRIRTCSQFKTTVSHPPAMHPHKEPGSWLLHNLSLYVGMLLLVPTLRSGTLHQIL